MAQPTQYNRLYNFVTYALANPSAPFNAAYTDAELNAIQLTLSEVLINLSLIQRDDGALKNGIVTQDSLSTSIAALFAAAGSTIRGAWLTATAYALKDVVTQSSTTYICALAHTSGVFATDLAASKWVALNSGTTVAAANVTSTPTGDVVATNADAAIAELASEKMAKSQNLADIPTRATAFANLVAAGGPMTGALTFSGARVNEAQGANVLSAGTIDLDAATGNLVDVTGTTPITAITLSQGREAVVRFTGVLTLTHGASLVLPGAASITTADGDFAVFRGYAAGVVRCVSYSRATGFPIMANPVIQEVEATPYTTYTSGSTAIPLDNSIPQNTEGVEYLTASITPRSVSSRLVVEFSGMVGADANRTVSVALFQDSTANALAVTAAEVPVSTSVVTMTLRHEMAAGTTSATTFKIRIGSAAGTVYINGNSAARVFGGAAALRMRIRECAA